MPSGIAEAVRRQVAAASKADLVVQESRGSRTGYTNVIEVRGKYQARLQVKGNGQRKRYQHPLPGLFDTALEAAQYLAMLKRDFGPGGVPPLAKQIEQRKLRTKKPQQAEPEQLGRGSRPTTPQPPSTRPRTPLSRAAAP
jgi:hypothetical protein